LSWSRRSRRIRKGEPILYMLNLKTSSPF
jgi:hypothetical protein